MRRPSVAKAMSRSPALKARIESAKSDSNGLISFIPEDERVKNVVLKLARGHAAYELSQQLTHEPDHYWCGTLSSLTEEQIDAFRNHQRMLAAEISMTSLSGGQRTMQLLVNDWIEVQEGYYRYLPIDDIGGVIIRIVIANYLASEIGWKIYD
jgi:hypothetical protein